jgi:hypothetical protein
MLLLNQFITFFIVPLGTAMFGLALAGAMNLKGLIRSARVVRATVYMVVVLVHALGQPLASRSARSPLPALASDPSAHSPGHGGAGLTHHGPARRHAPLAQFGIGGRQGLDPGSSPGVT